MRRGRAFTIAETLVVAVILGLMLAAIAGAVAPLFAAPDRAQAKADSLGPAAGDLYVLERDLREGDANATFACSGRPPVCGAGELDADLTALAVPTALASGSLDAQLLTDENSGGPSWSGFMVYRQDSGAQLDRIFVAEPSLAAAMSAAPVDRAVLQSLADQAALAAQAQTPDMTMRGIAAVSATVDPADGITNIHVVSLGAAAGRTNVSAFDDSVYSRN